MKFFQKFVFFLVMLFSTQFIFALERTEPVDLYIIIDKSISMDETNSFDSMKDWICNKFLKRCVAMEDFITVFIFLFSHNFCWAIIYVCRCFNMLGQL